MLERRRLTRTLFKRDVVMLDFNSDFMMWAIAETFKSKDDKYEMSFLCNGWEL